MNIILLIFTTQCVVYAVIVCPLQAKTAKHRITQITPYDSPWIKFFDAKDLGEIPTGSSQTGAPNRNGVGYNKIFFTNISL